MTLGHAHFSGLRPAFFLCLILQHLQLGVICYSSPNTMRTTIQNERTLYKNDVTNILTSSIRFAKKKNNSDIVEDPSNHLHTNLSNWQIGPHKHTGYQTHQMGVRIPGSFDPLTGNPKYVARRRFKRRTNRRRHRNDLSLWVNKEQVSSFGGYNSEIFVILNGRILPYILDPKFEDHLPVIPSEVDKVTFTWKSGRKRRYRYHFFILSSSDKKILQDPQVTVKIRGRIPRKPRDFSILIPCIKKAFGISSFHIGLMIERKRGKPLPGFPFSLKLKKRCERVEPLVTPSQPDPECNKKCSNGGICDPQKRCVCPQGYLGQFCHSALCYPQCQNGGTCTAPGKCSCQAGYQGRYCEGGICKDGCLNGGKCIQKDTCSCRRGFYGKRCEFSKCVIPCLNEGRCKGPNKCKCRPGFAGDHCEIIDDLLYRRYVSKCEVKCRHGTCQEHGKCQCDSGFSGRWCGRKNSRKRKLWI